MKWALFAFGVACGVCGQDSRTLTKVARDVNGNIVQGSQVSTTATPGGLNTTERMHSINGSMVPLERIEERVVREDSSARVLERIVHRYDPTGRPGPIEKTVIEEEKHAGGDATVSSTTWRGDLNGNLVPFEKSVTQKQNYGSTRMTESVVERQTLNGFQAVEKKTITQTGTKDHYQEKAVVYRKGEDGFYPAVSQTTNHSERNGIASDDTAEYEVGASGLLELHSQTMARTAKAADGGETREVDLFGTAVAGTIGAREAKLQLKEHEVVEKRPGAGGVVVETIRVSRPTISDPNTLGPAKVISETVCRGKCE